MDTNNYINKIQNAMDTDPTAFETHRRQEWFNQVKPEIVYNYETISKTRRIARICFAILIFPVGLGILLHKIVGKCLFSGWSKVNECRKETFNDWVCAGVEEENPKLPNVIRKRVQVLVNGTIVDAFICGRRENLNNGKWRLVATGIDGCMEDMNGYVEQDKNSEQNTLYFNYPGVGASKGWPSKAQIINSFKAMMHFLEDSENGIGAKEITCWGRSIGGAVAGIALTDHIFKQDIKYNVIRDRTFSRLSDTRWYAKFAKLVGWDLDGTAASEKLEEREIHETILQTAHGKDHYLLSDDLSLLSEKQLLKRNEDLYYDQKRSLKEEKIQDDGVIKPSCSLTHSLLSKRKDWKHKTFISVNRTKNHGGLPSLESCKKMNIAAI